MITLERLDSVALRGVPNIAALRVENHRNARVAAMNVVDRSLELVLGFVGRIVGELRLIGADEIGGGVDDRLVELEYRRGLLGELFGKALYFRIEPDTDQRIVAVPGALELLNKLAHATRARAL